MYALMSPKGRIIEDAIGSNKREAEHAAFCYMGEKLGARWESKFWKQWAEAQKDIRARGYRIVKVKLVLA